MVSILRTSHCTWYILHVYVVTKDEDEAEGSKVIWEWENDRGKWTKYDEEHCVQLTKSLTGGEENVTLQVTPTVKLNVRFSSMTQMNVNTGWQRDVRCRNSGRGQWEWEDEHGKWNTYSPIVQRLLVSCVECGVTEREIEAAGRKYKVDLTGKKQVNIETGVERKVRCTGESSGEYLHSSKCFLWGCNKLANFLIGTWDQVSVVCSYGRLVVYWSVSEVWLNGSWKSSTVIWGCLGNPLCDTRGRWQSL